MYQISNVTDLLGEARGRYFSGGFRGFNFHYKNPCFGDRQLLVEASLTWDTGWISETRHMHVGAIEYIAMGCSICEQLLVYVCKLTKYELADAQITYCKMKVSSSIALQQGDKVSIKGELINITVTDQDASKQLSTFKLSVGNAVLKLGVMHPVPQIKFERTVHAVRLNRPGLFNYGYKKRVFNICNIKCYVEEMICSATVISEELPVITGFGALHHGILPTDLISISGQLTQILICNLESKKKEELSNMWLRELNIIFKITNCKNDEKRINLSFKKFRQIKVNREWWRAVDLEVDHLGAEAKFKIAYKLD